MKTQWRLRRVRCFLPVIFKHYASPYKLEVFMSGHNIITIGVSADGLEALRTIVGNLPSEFPAAVFIVRHIGAGGPRALADILSRSGPLRAVYPEDRDPIQPGRIYVAPPDHHMSEESARKKEQRAMAIQRMLLKDEPTS
jgi:chemotaxis response regulator CheB